MAGKYKQGMVAQLLGGGQKSSEGKLATLFTVPASVVSTEPQRPKTAQSEKKKKKKKVQTEQAEEAANSPAKKKKKIENQGNVKNSETARISPQLPEKSEGFDPPPGIVHEALVNPSKKSGKKRKKSVSDDEESEDDQTVKRGIKEDKRPRRDRQKKMDEKRTVFVGNVPLTSDKKVLTRLFKQFGEIESVRFRCAPVADPATKKRVAVITKEFHDKRHNISAYICFKEEEAAKKAISLNGHLMDGLHLRVDSAKPVLKNINKRSVFVGNLRFAIEEESIREHFEDCGEIENVRVIRDRKTNLGKGFCYILFKSADSVSLALKLKNSELEKRQLRVQRCADLSKKDAKGKKLNKNSDDRKQTNTDKKAKKNMNKTPTNNNKAGQKPNNKRTHNNATTDPKLKRKKRMWQPTNASASQVFQSQKTALKRKQRKGEKKKMKKSKVDEVTRVLGPLQQPPAAKPGKAGGNAKKAKLQNGRRKDMKGPMMKKKNGGRKNVR